MRELMRLVALVMALSAVTSATAGAMTWHNSGDTAFTASAGNGLAFSGTSGVNVNCLNYGIAGTVAASPYVGFTWTALSGTLKPFGCTAPGMTLDVDCGYAFTASSGSGSVISGTVDLTCGIYLFGAKICHLEGAVSALYYDPSGTSAAQLITSTGNLVATSATTACPLGAADRITVGGWSFRVTSALGGPSPHLGPVITRTA